MSIYLFSEYISKNVIYFLGNSKVPIANCKEKYYNSQSKSEMNLSEFVNYWEKCINDEESELLYLKVLLL